MQGAPSGPGGAGAVSGAAAAAAAAAAAGAPAAGDDVQRRQQQPANARQRPPQPPPQQQTLAQQPLPAAAAVPAGAAVTNGAAHAAPAAAAQQQPRQQPAHLGVTCLLEFRHPVVESTYQAYMSKIQQAADVCVIAVNLFAVMVALVKQRVLPADGGPPGTATLCLLSGSQSLALLLLLLALPGVYARHRALLMAGSRLYRLGIWLLYLQSPSPARLFRDNLSLRLFLLSPASGNIWLALFYPLPVRTHLGLLAATCLVAIWPSAALQHRLAHMGSSPDTLLQAFTRLSRFSRLLEMPRGRLLQRWPAAVLSDADKVSVMYAFVTLVYGLLLPLLLLYVKEVHFRVRFLSCLRPTLSEPALARLRSGLYSATTRACFLLITLVPCAWSLVQLSSRYLAAQGGRLAPTGVAFLLTVLGLEVFMRFWLLAVLQLALHRVVRPALLWALLRVSRRQQQVAAAAGGGGRPAARGAAR